MDDTSSPQPQELRDGYNSSDTMPSNVSEELTRAQLDNARDVYKLIESRSELNRYQDRELVVKITDKLANHQNSVIEKLTEEGKAESVAGLSIDAHKLQLAVEPLKDVDSDD